MRVPLLVCAVLGVAVKSEFSSLYGPRLTARFRIPKNWDDNRHYDTRDHQTNNIDEIAFSQEGRVKRANFNSNYLDKRSDAQRTPPGPPLSIVNNLDVLRDRLILEIARKKAAEDANRNREYLDKIGKRSPFCDQKQCKDENTKAARFSLNSQATHYRF